MTAAWRLAKSDLPIKCLDATFLAALWTDSWELLDRFPLHFKSKASARGRKSHYHIVLAVQVCSRSGKESERWGALGLSRARGLGGKPPSYASLGELLDAFRSEYESVGHTLSKIRVGLPLCHGGSARIPWWRYCTLECDGSPWNSVMDRADEFAAEASELAWQYEKLES